MTKHIYTRTALVLSALLIVLAATSTSSVQDQADADLERARAAGMAFSTQLRQALRDDMAANGTVSALAFCAEQAPRIARTVMDQTGVRLGRVAIPHRERNPDNQAQPWQMAILDTFAQAVAQGKAPDDQVAVVDHDLPDGVALRWMRGIRVEAPCTICHGQNLAPAIEQELARLYPGDRATGFSEGDLRGALWVEVPVLDHPDTVQPEHQP